MKKGLTYLLAGLAVVAFSTVGFAMKGGIKGEITKVEGSMVTVKDDHGEEHMLHVDDTTKKEGDIAVGAHVEAEATGSGHAKSIMVHKKGEHAKEKAH